MTTAEITHLSLGEDHSFFAWRNVHVLVIGTEITQSIVETAFGAGVEFERRFPGPHGVLIDYHGSLRVPPFAVRTMVAEVSRRTSEHSIVARAIVVRGNGFLAQGVRAFFTAATGVARRYPQRFCSNLEQATAFLGAELGGLEPVRTLVSRVESEQRRLGLRID